MWNYYTLPVLLMRRSIIWHAIDPGMLVARFPASIPTHNAFQRFRFYHDTGLLTQHDDTAEVIERFARTAHVLRGHSASDGLRFASQRFITPRNAQGQPMHGPTLIEIRVYAVTMIAN